MKHLKYYVVEIKPSVDSGQNYINLIGPFHSRADASEWQDLAGAMEGDEDDDYDDDGPDRKIVKLDSRFIENDIFAGACAVGASPFRIIAPKMG